MSDDDFIAGMQMAVKKEVIENYLQERRIIQEETHLLFEEALAWHGGVEAWERQCVELWAVLLGGELAAELFQAAGVDEPMGPLAKLPGYDRPRAFSACGSFVALVERLYGDLYDSAAELAAESEKVHALRVEVNRDIEYFEVNHDMLAIGAYLRSLDIQEIQRTKILGSNFTAKERMASAASLSFRPFGISQLEMEEPGPNPAPPKEVLPPLRRALKTLCRANRPAVDALWRVKGRSAKAL